MRLSLASLLLLAALPLARPAHAQLPDPAATVGPWAWSPVVTPPRVAHPAPAVRMERERPQELLALGGVLGGGAGLVVGGIAGSLLQGGKDPDCIDFCFGWQPIVGALAGEAFGVALGVHLANGRRGSLPLGMLTSAGILTVGAIAGHETPEMLLVVPVSQVIAAVTVERGTERRR